MHKLLQSKLWSHLLFLDLSITVFPHENPVLLLFFYLFFSYAPKTSSKIHKEDANYPFHFILKLLFQSDFSTTLLHLILLLLLLLLLLKLLPYLKFFFYIYCSNEVTSFRDLAVLKRLRNPSCASIYINKMKKRMLIIYKENCRFLFKFSSSSLSETNF